MCHLESENEGIELLFNNEGKILKQQGHNKPGHSEEKKKKKKRIPRQNNLYGVNRKTMTISNAHYMFNFFSPDCHFFLISSPLPQSFSPQPRNPSRSLPFIATEIHSTCPLIGILLFLYLCIPLFIQNHMLMKSVIINLKYLIFRSVSASEGG